MVFYATSPRNVTIDQAQALCDAMLPFTSRVGLFVDAEEQFVREVINQVPLDLLQFHGSESANYCNQFGKPYIKAIRMEADLLVEDRMKEFPDAAAILLDSYSGSVAGGTGETFDWSRIPSHRSRPLILAGGLNVGNVFEAIQAVRPYAVDVSSGVELQKGVKDIDKMSTFINEVNRQS